MNSDVTAVATKSGRKWKDEPWVLFVEGYSDLTFYAEFMQHVGHPTNSYFIQDLGGKGRSKLANEAKVLLRPDRLTTIRSVAILLDADSNANGAFESARDAIKAAIGVTVLTPNQWTPRPESSTRFGIFVVGGSDRTGEIETLVWQAWKTDKNNVTLSTCVDEFIACASQSKRYQTTEKAKIGAALSILNEDDPRLGSGARARLFDFNAPAFSELKAFLAP